MIPELGYGATVAAFQGKPLYTFVQDKQPGDVKGDNFKGIWHAVKE